MKELDEEYYRRKSERDIDCENMLICNMAGKTPEEIGKWQRDYDRLWEEWHKFSLGYIQQKEKILLEHIKSLKKEWKKKN